MENPGLELALSVTSDDYDPNDPRWRAQLNDLYRMVRDQADDFRQEVEPVEGRKGGIETIIVAMGTAGAFKAIVETFAHWLKRDRSRHIRLTTKQGDEERVIEVDANGIDAATLTEILKTAAFEQSD